MSTKGRHEEESEWIDPSPGYSVLRDNTPPDCPEKVVLSATQRELEAAWNDGHEAANEEMRPDLDAAYRSFVLHRAVEDDEVLSPAQVKLIWEDSFLSNVIVPFLRHIVGVQEAAIEELEEELTYPREQAFNDLMHEHLSAQIIALSKAIIVVDEWRG